MPIPRGSTSGNEVVRYNTMCRREHVAAHFELGATCTQDESTLEVKEATTTVTTTSLEFTSLLKTIGGHPDEVLYQALLAPVELHVRGFRLHSVL